jgi:hypothetical protein
MKANGTSKIAPRIAEVAPPQTVDRADNFERNPMKPGTAETVGDSTDRSSSQALGDAVAALLRDGRTDEALRLIEILRSVLYGDVNQQEPLRAVATVHPIRRT